MRLSVAVMYCVCAASIAWADEPTSSPSATPSSQPATATAPAPAPAPASTTTAEATKTTSNSHANAPAPDTTVLVKAQEEKKWRSQGYKPEKRGDETFWCRREATIGSRFEEKKCWTAATLEENERNSQHYVEEVQHTSNPGGR
jgi:hypothetical protein